MTGHAGQVLRAPEGGQKVQLWGRGPFQKPGRGAVPAGCSLALDACSYGDYTCLHTEPG